LRLIDRLHATYWFWRARRALKAGDPEKAALFADMIEEIVPGHGGLESFREEVHTAAIGLARQRVREEPNNPEWRGDFSRALLEENRLDEAAEQVRRGLRLLQNDKRRELLQPEMLLIAGEIEYNRGHYRRAIDLLDRGAEPGFGMAAIHYYRGLCHLALRDRRACRREFTALVNTAYWIVGIRHQELARNQLGQPALLEHPEAR